MAPGILEKQPTLMFGSESNNTLVCDSCMGRVGADFYLCFITGFSIGLYPYHGHHHVLCCHVHGWHSQHGHLVLLDPGKHSLYFSAAFSDVAGMLWIAWFSFPVFFSSCTKSDLRELGPRLCSSSVWSSCWLSSTPATWSTAWHHNMWCMAARSISHRWGKHISLRFWAFSDWFWMKSPQSVRLGVAIVCTGFQTPLCYGSCLSALHNAAISVWICCLTVYLLCDLMEPRALCVGVCSTQFGCTVVSALCLKNSFKQCN